MVSETLAKIFETVSKIPRKELMKGVIYSTAYFFMLTITGIFIVTVYNYFFPIDVTSELSILNVALIFATWIIIDFGLIFSRYPTPTIILTLIIIAPILIIYRLLKSNDLILIDRNVPTKIKRYIHPNYNWLKNNAHAL